MVRLGPHAADACITCDQPDRMEHLVSRDAQAECEHISATLPRTSLPRNQRHLLEADRL